MIDLAHYKQVIATRLAELDTRMHEIDTELSTLKPTDWEDQAVDKEDDEVLEGLGHAAEKEVTLLQKAMSRIEDGTFGICLKCEDPISSERLEAVPYAPLCRNCAGAGK